MCHFFSWSCQSEPAGLSGWHWFFGTTTPKSSPFLNDINPSCFLMACSNALPVFAACTCRECALLSLLDDVSTAWPWGDIQAWIYSQMAWNVLNLFSDTGLEAHLCDVLQPHTVTVWETEPVPAVVQALLHFHSCLGWNCNYHKAQVPHCFVYSLLCKGCWFGQHMSNRTQCEKARWVAGCAASSLLKGARSVTWVLFSVSQLWFHSSDLLHVAYS